MPDHTRRAAIAGGLAGLLWLVGACGDVEVTPAADLEVVAGPLSSDATHAHATLSIEGLFEATAGGMGTVFTVGPPTALFEFGQIPEGRIRAFINAWEEVSWTGEDFPDPLYRLTDFGLRAFNHFGRARTRRTITTDPIPDNKLACSRFLIDGNGCEVDTEDPFMGCLDESFAAICVIDSGPSDGLAVITIANLVDPSSPAPACLMHFSVYNTVSSNGGWPDPETDCVTSLGGPGGGTVVGLDNEGDGLFVVYSRGEIRGGLTTVGAELTDASVHAMVIRNASTGSLTIDGH